MFTGTSTYDISMQNHEKLSQLFIVWYLEVDPPKSPTADPSRQFYTERILYKKRLTINMRKNI
jgi:hypothetical protein